MRTLASHNLKRGRKKKGGKENGGVREGQGMEENEKEGKKRKEVGRRGKKEKGIYKHLNSMNRLYYMNMCIKNCGLLLVSI